MKKAKNSGQAKNGNGEAKKAKQHYRNRRCLSLNWRKQWRLRPALVRVRI